MQLNWNDLKYLLTLSRLGQVSGVAREHGVDATTVSRRIKALEEVLGCQLFLRVDNRYLPTEALQRVLQNAERVEREIGQITHGLSERDTHLQGKVRITSVHTFINSYLLPRLARFYARYPDIELEIVAESSQLDLGRHEADLAIRMGRPSQQSIVTRKLTDLHYAVYGQRTLVEAGTSVGQLPWIFFEERYSSLPEARWQQRHFPDVKARLYCNVGPAMLTAVKSGLGVACLPSYMAQAEPGLVSLLPSFNLRELWLLLHPEKRNLARVRAFIDWLEQEITQDRALFYGQSQETVDGPESSNVKETGNDEDAVW